jgi:hypothetical protein
MFSSDLVFDGAKTEPYLEGDATRPLSTFGRTKADAKRLVLERLAGAAIVRTSTTFGGDGSDDLVAAAMLALQTKARVRHAEASRGRLRARFAYRIRLVGGVAEWSKAAVLKTAVDASPPGVRISSPPLKQGLW